MSPEIKPRVLGVLGGMGPAATADFLAKLVKVTPARRDQDHLPVLTCSIPQIPDRTEAILNAGPSPLPALLSSLAMLERGGASCVAIPCNTAHFWFSEMQRHTVLPIIHIVDACLRAMERTHPHLRAVGLLATTATVRSGVYEGRLARLGIECLVPERSDQALIMNVIRTIKSAGADAGAAATVEAVAARLLARGAASVILGCTELPLALAEASGRYIDATEALARECVRRLGPPPYAAALRTAKRHALKRRRVSAKLGLKTS